MLPTTQIIDLRQEFKKGNRSIFSGELHKKIECLAKKEQIMLFLNRVVLQDLFPVVPVDRLSSVHTVM